MSGHKSIPTCHGCGRMTCADCGMGFPTREAYLRHRVEAHVQGPGPEPAPA